MEKTEQDPNQDQDWKRIANCFLEVGGTSSSSKVSEKFVHIGYVHKVNWILDQFVFRLKNVIKNDRI